jgi:hypothetical protein
MCGFASGDCDECRLLGYKNPVLTSNETHYITTRPSELCYVRFEVFMAVTMKIVVFWDVMPSGSCKKRRFGGWYCLYYQGQKNSSLIPSSLMMKALRFLETFVLAKATRRYIPEDGILLATTLSIALYILVWSLKRKDEKIQE